MHDVECGIPLFLEPSSCVLPSSGVRAVQAQEDVVLLRIGGVQALKNSLVQNPDREDQALVPVRTQLEDFVGRITQLAASVRVEILDPKVRIVLENTLHDVKRVSLDVDSGSELDQPLIQVEAH